MTTTETFCPELSEHQAAMEFASLDEDLQEGNRGENWSEIDLGRQMQVQQIRLLREILAELKKISMGQS